MSIVAIYLLLMVQSASAEQVVRIAIGEWQPYLSENAPHYGFASHIITESFALQDITVDHGFLPWKRAYQLSQRGEKWDGTGVWLHNEERANDFFYSEPVIPTTVSFFHLKNNDFDWSAISNLSDEKIGVTLGYSYGPKFDAAVEDGTIKAEQSRTDTINLRKLLKGRIDVLPGEQMSIYSLINELFPPEIAEQFTHHSVPIHEDSQHLLLSKSNPENEQLIEIFNTGLLELKEGGLYDKIISDGLAGEYNSQ